MSAKASGSGVVSGKPPKPAGGATFDLPALQQKKANLLDDLKKTERQIFELEQRYIEDTNHHGNVLRGFDGFFQTKGRVDKKRGIKDVPRLFSMSSTTSPLAVSRELAAREEDAPRRPMYKKKKHHTISSDEEVLDV